MSLSPAEEWIELLLKRGDELRRKGILSIGCDGNSAVLAPLEPGSGTDTADAAGFKGDDDDESPNAWENGSSYPSGHVPSLHIEDDLPDIPTFDQEP